MIQEKSELSKVIISKNYRELLAQICSDINCGFTDEVPEVLLDHDVRKMNAANLAVTDLTALIETEGKPFQKFSVMKFCELRGEIDDGEFPVNEPQSADERSTVVETHPMYANFLISYMIEYTLATRYLERLESFLKSMRYPFAKKYAKQLKGWAEKSAVAGG